MARVRRPGMPVRDHFDRLYVAAQKLDRRAQAVRVRWFGVPAAEEHADRLIRARDRIYQRLGVVA
jgi:hypothetical protein